MTVQVVAADLEEVPVRAVINQAEVETTAAVAADGLEEMVVLMEVVVQDLLEEKAGLMVEVEELDTTPLLEQKGLMEDLVALQE